AANAPLQAPVAGPALHDGAVDVHAVERHRLEQPRAGAPGAEARERKAEAPLAQRRAERLDLRQVARRALLGHLEAQSLRLRAARAQVIVEPLEEASVADGLLRQAHEQTRRLLLRR